MKTIAGLNRQNKSKFVLTDGAIFIAPQKLHGIELTDSIEEAEIWTFADTLSCKRKYFTSITKLNLKWVEI